MIGTNGLISSFDSSTTTRDWYIGTQSNKNLNNINEKKGQIVMYSGRTATNINPGNNKINTYSTGLLLHRGGPSEFYCGEIGATNSANQHLYINGNSSNNIVIDSALGQIHTYSNGLNFYRGNLARPYIGTIGCNTGNPTDETFYISGTGINNINIRTDAGQIFINGTACNLDFNNFRLGTGTGVVSISTRNQDLYFNQNVVIETALQTQHINLRTNTLFIGSGAAANGRFSNINMLDAGGQNWETQSSAFTEALKAKLQSYKSFNNNTGKIEFTQASFGG